MSIRSALRWTAALLFPPVCRCCGKRQSIFAPNLPQVLCACCLNEWAERMQESCPLCGKQYSHCLCMTQALQDAGACGMVKLACYRSGKRDVTAHMLLRCKDVNDRALFGFLAADLALPLFRAIQALGADVRQTVVTYVPRQKRALRAVGHDQAKELAKALARRLDLACESVICRVGWQRQQKELSADERLQNAEHSFAPTRRGRVKGKTVLLVDDICTTGASLARCTQLLYEAGAKRVIAVCVAQAEHKKEAE